MPKGNKIKEMRLGMSICQEEIKEMRWGHINRPKGNKIDEIGAYQYAKRK